MTNSLLSEINSSENLAQSPEIEAQLLILRQLESIDQELGERQRKLKILYYVPHLIQFCFHICRKRTKAFFGGNRSGKTTSNIIELIWHMTKLYPVWYPEENKFRGRVKARIVCNDFTKAVEEVITEKLNEWIPEGYLADKKRNQQGHFVKYIFKDGSFFDIMTYEQEAKQHEGADRDLILYDEPPPRDIRIAEKRGLVDRNGREMFGLTPLSEPWIFDEIYESPDTDNVASYVADMRDNLQQTVNENYVTQYRYVPEDLKIQYLKHFGGRKIGCHTEDAIKYFEQGLTQDEKEARIHGKFMFLQGRVYKEFSEIHVIDPITLGHDWPRYFSLDPHDRKPQTCIWGAVDPTEDVYIYREREFALPGTIKDAVAGVKEVEQRHRERIVRRLIDPNFGAKIYANSGRTVAEEWTHASMALNYRISFTLANDDLTAGHNKVHEYLKYDPTKKIDFNNHPKLYIFRTCPRLIESMRKYVWDEWEGKAKDKRDQKEQPRDKYKDFPDTLRYMLMDNPRFKSASMYIPNRISKY